MFIAASKASSKNPVDPPPFFFGPLVAALLTVTEVVAVLVCPTASDTERENRNSVSDEVVGAVNEAVAVFALLRLTVVPAVCVH